MEILYWLIFHFTAFYGAESLRLEAQIFDGLRALESTYVDQVFAEFSTAISSDNKETRNQGFISAMRALKIPWPNAEAKPTSQATEKQSASQAESLPTDQSPVDQLFREIDIDIQKPIDSEKFKLVTEHSSAFEQFVRSIPIWKIVVHAIPRNKEYFDISSKEMLETMASLSHQQICSLVKAMYNPLIELIKKHVNELKMTQNALKKREDNTSSGKFVCFQMKTGGIDDFHNGLQERVG